MANQKQYFDGQGKILYCHDGDRKVTGSCVRFYILRPTLVQRQPLTRMEGIYLDLHRTFISKTKGDRLT